MLIINTFLRLEDVLNKEYIENQIIFSYNICDAGKYKSERDMIINFMRVNIDNIIKYNASICKNDEFYIKYKKNIIMVNVEADVLCGKYLSDLAKKNNVIYSMAYGDQPALIMEQIEWAKLNGFLVAHRVKLT